MNENTLKTLSIHKVPQSFFNIAAIESLIYIYVNKQTD